MTLFDKAQALKFPNLVAINFDHRSDLEEFPGSFWLYHRLFSISVFLKKSSIDFQPSYFFFKENKFLWYWLRSISSIVCLNFNDFYESFRPYDEI
jgi:hypothetical protein